MSYIYSLEQSANWRIVWSQRLVAENAPHPTLYYYYPIPRTKIPISFSSPVLGIYANTSSSERKKYAGSIFQKISTGIVSDLPDNTYVTARKFYLNQITLLNFVKYTNNYSLELLIPFWLRDIDITIWEYTGTIEDPVENKVNIILNNVTSSS